MKTFRTITTICIAALCALATSACDRDTGATYQAIASGGLTYAVNDNWVIDVGGTVGLSDSADDFSVFLGTSFRF